MSVETDAMAAYLALRGGPPSLLLLDGKPPSKPRPRFGQGRAYSSKEQRAAEAATGYALRAQQAQPLDGDLCMVMVFWLPDLKRRDADNLVKHLWDAANGVLWHDDVQVRRSAQILDLDRRQPRTEILLGRLD